MTKKILAFAASSSKKSINKKLATWASNQIKNTETEVLDLNDFEMPLYSIDKEITGGIPSLAIDFKAKIDSADGIVISFAEHNGSFSVAFKNIYDWVSRIDMAVWQNKPLFILATSPGPKGGSNVLSHAVAIYSYTNKNTLVNFSLPSFNDNFDEEKGITNSDLSNEFIKQLETFANSLG